MDGYKIAIVCCTACGIVILGLLAAAMIHPTAPHRAPPYDAQKTAPDTTPSDKGRKRNSYRKHGGIKGSRKAC